jgi:methionyl-tRNA formyltransferase
VRIAYFGLPLAALLLLEDGHEIELAVMSRSDAVGLRRLGRRLGSARMYKRAPAPLDTLATRCRAASIDLVVSWFWTTKLPATLIGAARLGGIGVHPSLLPRHRGPDPYFAAIDQGDRVTGVTLHRIADEYDTGPILSTEEIAVDERWNAWQLARRLDRPSIALLRRIVSRLAAGENVPERPQDEKLASWAPVPAHSDCALLWSWTTDRLLRRIRALAPAPGAFTEIHGQMLTVLRAERAPDFPRALEPGEAAVVGDAGVVRTADGAVLLLEGEIEGTVLDRRGLASVVARGSDLVLL